MIKFSATDMRKVLNTVFTFTLVILLAFILAWLVHSKESVRKIAPGMLSLPDVNFVTLNNDSANLVTLSENKPAIIIYFSPDCEHCQNEAAQLQKNIQQLSNAVILMITPFSADDARQFAVTYLLNDQPNVYFLLDRDDRFYQTFGIQEFPTVLVYNKTHHLAKISVGETGIKNIINSVNNN